MTERSHGNLPDFILIGAMKCGTSTLYRWLAEHPDVLRARTKEPNFFGDETKWARGLDWYRSLFPITTPFQRVGEGSTHYTWPDVAPLAARRARSIVPEARLICVLREPEARMRSHYRHSVQRRQEHRTFLDAIAAPSNAYVRVCNYKAGLEPWLQNYPRQQLLVVRFEDLYGPSDQCWRSVLDHLGLSPIDRPTTEINRSGRSARLSPVARAMADSPRLKWLAERLPSGIRRSARTKMPFLLARHSRRYERLIGSSRDALPEETCKILRAQQRELNELLESAGVGWR